jgi:hypothetical protein
MRRDDVRRRMREGGERRGVRGGRGRKNSVINYLSQIDLFISVRKIIFQLRIYSLYILFTVAILYKFQPVIINIIIKHSNSNIPDLFFVLNSCG